MAMQQLSGLDAAFLAMETDTVTGHVGSICIVDPATVPGGVLDVERLRELVGERLHLVPPFRRRLVGVPFGLDNPYWIEDPNFDLTYHVRALALPAPGNDRQLAEQAGRLHARHLDRSHPLWEMYLITGLAGGRAAIYTKVHHAAIDGVSGNDLLAALLDRSPEGRDLPPAPPWECDEVPSQVERLVRGAVSLTGHPLRAAKLSLDMARRLPGVATSQGRPRLPVIDRLLGRGAGAVLTSPPLRAPSTPFNKPITRWRRWAFRTLPLDDVKAVKNVHPGTTVNDVVMGLCAGALRRWLLDHDALPASPLVAAVPVSIRTKEREGTGGNAISAMVAPLPTHLEDAGERLVAAHEAMGAAKDQHGALPATLLTDVAQFAMPALAGQAARLSARLRVLEFLKPFNLIISNVPGPQVPLYYAGAELLALYPLSAIADGQGLNITVMSYRNGVYAGLVADRELVPDLEQLADYLQEELRVLLARTVAPHQGARRAGRAAAHHSPSGAA
jgi:diacylglycerol O-acyltransferase